MSGLIRRLDSRSDNFEIELTRLLGREEESDSAVEARVAGIIGEIRRDGDAALLEYTRRFDGWNPDSAGALEIAPELLAEALERIPGAQRAALETAAGRIRDYHARQLSTSWSYRDAHGNLLGQQITPIERVGVYVPGGKAAYPSSVLMNVLPAKVAGVTGIVMVSPTPGGELNPLVLAAAAIAGVDRCFAVGGAQAVAALAYGTATIPRVDKIVGPGNIYVATAKRQLFGTVGIDMVAGPSEILVVSDGQTAPDWMAMDLFSQAEHDESAQSLLIAWHDAHLDAVEASIERLLPTMERREIIATSLRERGALIRVPDLGAALELANRIAPEHLELAIAEPEAQLANIRNAGAIFLGRYTPEAIGDYCAGPNHVLPTSSTARFSSPLGVYDFQKRSSIIGCSPEGGAELAAIASVLARGESLTAHAISAELRYRQRDNDDS